LEGLTFVVSGAFENISRNDLESFIVAKGGKLTGSVSGKTNYLVVGHKMDDGRDVNIGGKFKKAQEKGVNILTEEQFEQFIQRKSGLTKF
jgi:NAD-dependent DNA ligase